MKYNKKRLARFCENEKEIKRLGLKFELLPVS